MEVNSSENNIITGRPVVASTCIPVDAGFYMWGAGSSPGK